MKRHIHIAIVLGLLGAVSAKAETSVNWSNTAGTALRDNNGNLLTQGSTANTDGDLIQLGYFSAGNAANNFAGTWIPLTGAGAIHTAIGDSSDLSGSGNGIIQFNTFFTAGTNQVQVYDASAGDTGQYFTQSSFTLTNTLPASNQILAIRFFDTTAGTSGHYNTVSSDSWTWQTPNTAGGGLVNIDLANPGVGTPLEWQDSANPFRTSISIAAVPEPSTYISALMGLGGIGIATLRRRFQK